VYLFEKSFEVHKEPFLYFTIENALEESVANTLLATYFYKKSSIWEKFISIQLDKLKDTVELFDNKFNLLFHDLDYEINFPHYGPNGGKIIRDWHIDGCTKKYQIIYYLGGADPAGHTELSNESGTQQKLLPFKHNRVLVFHNTRKKWPSWHRFFGTTECYRLTFNMPLLYKL